MFHPLEEDLSKYPIEEIEKRLFDLTKKYNAAMHLGQPQLLTQLQTFVTIYRNELSERHMKQMREQDENLDALINVDKQ